MRLLAVCFVLTAATAAAQPAAASRFNERLVQRADVRDALAFVDRNFDAQVAEWIEVNEIPAPSGREAERATYVRAQLEELGLKTSTDDIGNLWAVRKGSGGGPTLVLTAHLDTVFPLATDVHVRRMLDGTLHAPGIFDNTASVIDLLQAARAVNAAKLRTAGDIVFLFTVQEEIGLKGMYRWMADHKGLADLVVAIDAGLGPVNYGALGIYWSKMHFTAPGAHTNLSRGQPNPVRAAAQCITAIYTVPLPPAAAPVSAVYNVGGMMSAGTVVNAIPSEVTFTVDLRTVDAALIADLDAAIVAKCAAAALAHKVGFSREWMQRSEPGGRPEQLTGARAHPLVQTSVDVLRYLGVELPRGGEAVATGSTDANVGVLAKIPSIAIGRSRGGDQHTLQEWSDIETAKIGTKQIVLLAAALTGLH